MDTTGLMAEEWRPLLVGREIVSIYAGRTQVAYFPGNATPEENLARATLMAAAPGLLRACVEVMDSLNGHPGPLSDMLTAAITAATTLIDEDGP